MSSKPTVRAGAIRRAVAALAWAGLAIGCTGDRAADRAADGAAERAADGAADGAADEADASQGSAAAPVAVTTLQRDATAATALATRDGSTPPAASSTAADGRQPVESSGCGTSPVREVLDERIEFTVDGAERWFLLTTPQEHDGVTPLPLVVDFHGLSEGAQVHALTSEMPAYAQGHGFVSVLPEGTGAPVRWDVEPDVTSNPDLRFVTRLLDRLERRLCIDTSRVYATGFSNGAFMSSSIACAMSDRFAAVAPIAGANILCDGFERPMPVFAIHGTRDPILLFNGGVNLDNVPGVDPTVTSSAPAELQPADLDGAGYPENMMRWARFNGCERTPTEKSIADDVLLRRWNCPANGDVEFVIVLGGGHTWPGSEFTESIESIVGPTTMNYDATDAMWRFFSRFRLPAD